MPDDPKFVRQSDALSSSVLVDIDGGSGWSISGTEVVPFPSAEGQARFVRSALVAGKLEAAGQAEYDEQTQANERYDELVKPALHATPVPGQPDTGQTHQEEAIQNAADAVRAGEAGSADHVEGADAVEGEGTAGTADHEQQGEGTPPAE